jgi:hypothetical protein
MPSWLLPALAGGASLVSGLLGNRARSNQAKDQAKLYNDWLKQYQQTGQGLMGQAQAAGWNPFGPKTSTSFGTTTGSSSMRGGGEFSNRPQITEEYQPLDALMRGIMTQRLAGGSSLPEGYASSAARGINESFAGADQAARNMAARRGLSGEQTYAVGSPIAAQRAGALADMRSSLPLLEREMQNQDIGLTQGLQSAFGRGEAGKSSQWQQGSQSSQTSGQSTTPFGAGDLSALMSILAPPSPMQSGQTGTSGLATGLDSLGGLLGFLAANQSGKPQNPMMQLPTTTNRTGLGYIQP